MCSIFEPALAVGSVVGSNSVVVLAAVLFQMPQSVAGLDWLPVSDPVKGPPDPISKLGFRRTFAPEANESGSKTSTALAIRPKLSMNPECTRSGLGPQ